MNIFKNLLFLHGHLVDPRLDEDEGFGPTYGNRTASEKHFGPTYGRHDADPKQHADADCLPVGCG